MLRSIDEHKVILYRGAMGTKLGDAPAVGVRITVGYADSIIYTKQDFNEQWYQDKRCNSNVKKYSSCDGYQ